LVEVAAAVEGVDVDHHGGGPVDSGPMVGEECLGPTTKLVAGAGVGGDLLDGVAVTNSVEVGAGVEEAFELFDDDI
jgi:hypothetical protein